MPLVPDPLTIEILRQGAGPSYRIRLELPDGTLEEGLLNLDDLMASLAGLEPVWLSGDPAAYGRHLFNALFSGTLGFRYGAASAAAGQRGIRLYLRCDPQAPQLHTVPWERLYHPQGTGWAPLAASPTIWFSRFLSVGQPWGLPAASGPLRALMVISSPYPAGHPLHVDVAQERESLTDVLDQFSERIHYEFLEEPATLDAIVERLEEDPGYDILHYTGHGVWKPEEQTAYLILEKLTDQGVRPDGVSAGDLVGRLGLGRHLPRLIFLAACESAQQSTKDAFLGLGPQLVAAGCPAVVAMQEKVEVVVAREFARRFYRELLEHGIVDLAVNRARQGLYQNWDWQWAVPVLFMRLLNGVLFHPQERFRAPERKPYKGLTPYTPADADLFFGRPEESVRVYQAVQSSPLVVVYGEAGAGLTSLLQAGVWPRLEQDGDRVLRVAEYTDLATALRMDYGAPLQLAGDAAPAAVLQAIQTTESKRLVVILDQLERVFDLPAEAQKAVVEALVEALQTLGNALRLVLAIREDRLADLLTWREDLPGLMQNMIPVLPLRPSAAEEAVVRPLQALDWPVALVPPTLARDLIVPELVQLSEHTDTVDPGHLQIVCQWLYDKALVSPAGKAITEQLYLAEKGADGIMARFMEQTLQTQLAHERTLAEHVLVAMATAGPDRWVTPDHLPRNGASQEQVEEILARLVGAELVVHQAANGSRRYALANRAVMREARRLGGREDHYQAADEVERVWSAWLARETLASAGSLRYLAKASKHLSLEPVQALLLLRSAVARDMPVEAWVDALRRDAGQALVEQLETGAGLADAPRPSRTTLHQAAELLGLNDISLPAQSSAEQPFGRISWAAVSHPEAVIRQTAALALAAADRYSALNRLDWALRTFPKGWQRRRRAAEARGVISDADPEIARMNAELPPLDRIAVWGWRARRRVLRGRHRLVALTVGGAIGGGLGLALLRGAIGFFLPNTRAAIQFAMYFYWAAIPAAALCLGLVLAELLLLRSQESDGSLSPLWRAPLHPDRLPAVLGCVLGWLFWGMAHGVVALFNGLQFSRQPLVPVMGFVAGCGLALALYRQPRAGWHLGLGNWLLRLATASVAFVATQGVFVKTGGPGIALAWSGAKYKGELLDFVTTKWPQMGWEKPWYEGLALLDAALVGVVLTVGITAGLFVAGNWLARWQTLVIQAGD